MEENFENKNSERPAWRRIESAKMVGGVCAGLANTLNIDPNLVRIAFAALTLVSGGWPLLVYGALWLYLPNEEGKSIGLKNPTTKALAWVNIVGAVLLLFPIALVVILLFGVSFGPAGSLRVFFLAGLLIFLLISMIWTVVVLIRRAARGEVVRIDSNQVGEFVATTIADAFTGKPRPEKPTFTVLRPEKPKREKSALGGMTMSAMWLVLGVMWLANAMGLRHFEGVSFVYAATAVIGAGLVVGAWVGRARWLMLLAVPLLAMSVMLSFIPVGMKIDYGTGTRYWNLRGATYAKTPTGGVQYVSYELGAGQAQLNLRGVVTKNPTANIDVQADVLAGQLRVNLDDECDIRIFARVGAGDLVRSMNFSRHNVIGGSEAHLSGTALARAYSSGPMNTDATCRITVHANVAYGVLEVQDDYARFVK